MHGPLHHVELWVDDLAVSEPAWQALFRALGHAEHQRWERGVSWKLGPTYVVLEQTGTGGPLDRLRPGLNHLAFHVRDLDLLPGLHAAGWTLLFADRHPWAGGPQHEAAYLEGPDGFEVELVVTR